MKQSMKIIPASHRSVFTVWPKISVYDIGVSINDIIYICKVPAHFSSNLRWE